MIADPTLQKEIEILTRYFGADCSNTGDLDEIARLIALKARPDEKYTRENVYPWTTLYEAYINALEKYQDHDTAWLAMIDAYPLDVQQALRNIVQALINQHVQAHSKKKTRIKTKEYLALFKKLGFDFALNAVDDTIYVNKEILSDIVFSQVYRACVDSGAPVGENDIRHCIAVAAKNNSFHPVKDYLDALSWDGEAHIQRLSEYFVDKYNVFSLYLRKWLIGAVARVYAQGKQNPMLVLDGKQGIGKSFFARWLTPSLTMFNEGAIQPENKDDQIRLIGVWIWEVKELGSTFRRADIEALKSFLTMESVRVRRPYAHYDILKPAISSFIGTINNVEGFLSDPTGSRRFNIAHILNINWDYRKDVDRDQVWAEAKAAFLSGENWMLSAAEEKIRDEVNANYEVEDPIENVLGEFFEIDPKQTAWYTSVSEIVRVLEDPYHGAGLKMGGSRATTMHLARAMAKLGCEKRRRANGTRGYVGVKKKIH